MFTATLSRLAGHGAPAFSPVRTRHGFPQEPATRRSASVEPLERRLFLAADWTRPPEFMIGVWQQPKENFQTWYDRGANTMFAMPEDRHPVQWTAAAANEQHPLWVIREPVRKRYRGPNDNYVDAEFNPSVKSAIAEHRTGLPTTGQIITDTTWEPASTIWDPKADAGTPNLLGYLQPDEPDIKYAYYDSGKEYRYQWGLRRLSSDTTRGGDHTPFTQWKMVEYLQETYAHWNAALQTANTPFRKRIYMTLTGHINGPEYRLQKFYNDIEEDPDKPVTDFYGIDAYPINTRGNPSRHPLKTTSDQTVYKDPPNNTMPWSRGEAWIDWTLSRYDNPFTEGVDYPSSARESPHSPGTSFELLRDFKHHDTNNSGTIGVSYDEKAHYAVIETSFQKLEPQGTGDNKTYAGRQPTAAEVNGQIWDGIIRGAKGIVYFPFTFPFHSDANFDGTPPDVATTITHQNDRIKALAAVIRSPAPPPESGMTMRVVKDFPSIQGTWRSHNGTDYYIVQNMSHKKLTAAGFYLKRGQPLGEVKILKDPYIHGASTTETRRVGPGGFLSETFEPYETRIYTAPSGGPVVINPDTLEPNNSASSPTDFSPATRVLRDQLTLHDRDVDFYKLTASAAGTLSASISFARPNGNMSDLDLELRSADGTQVLASSVGTGKDSETVSHSVAAGGVYLLKVFGPTGATNGNYTLRIDAPNSRPQPPNDNFEPNNALAEASTIPTPAYWDRDQLTLPTGDVDYFRLTAGASGTLGVSVSFNESEGDVDLELRDSTDQVLASSDGPGAGESVAHPVTAGQTYYVKVHVRGDGVSSRYRLIIDGPDVPIPPDRFEPNNGASTGTRFGRLGDRVETGLSIHAQHNDDYFSFSGVENGTVTVSTMSSAAGDLDLQLIDDDGVTVVATSANLGTSNESITRSINRGQVYFVRVFGRSGATNSAYSISVDGPNPPAPPAADRFEPNDTGATPAGLGFVVSRAENNLTVHAPNNEDFFRVKAAGDGRMTASIAFDRAWSNLDLHLLENDGKTVIRRSQGTATNVETISWQAHRGAAYILRVFGRDGMTSPDYDLAVTGPQLPPPPPPSLNRTKVVSTNRSYAFMDLIGSTRPGAEVKVEVRRTNSSGQNYWDPWGQTDVANSRGVWKLQTVKVPRGNFRIRVTATITDSSGNQASSKAVYRGNTASADSAPVLVSSLMSSDGSSLEPASASLTSSGVTIAPLISGIGADGPATGGSLIAANVSPGSVVFWGFAMPFADVTLVRRTGSLGSSGGEVVQAGSAVADHLGRWQFEYTNDIASGSYTFTASDDMGVVSRPFQVNFGTAAPAPFILQAASGEVRVVNGSSTGINTTWRVSGTAAPGQTVTAYDLEAYYNGYGGYGWSAAHAVRGTATADAYGDWSFDYAPGRTTDGYVDLVVTAGPLGQSTSSASPTTRVYFDYTAATLEKVSANLDVGVAGVDSITITFSEPVHGLDAADFSIANGTDTIALTRATLDTADNIHWTISGLSAIGLTDRTGSYTLTHADPSKIRDEAGNALGNGFPPFRFFVINGDTNAANRNDTIRLAATAAGNVGVYVNGSTSPAYELAPGSVEQILVSGLEGDDRLVDELSASLHPVRGVSYSGGAGADSADACGSSQGDTISVSGGEASVTTGNASGALCYDDTVERLTVFARGGNDSVYVDENGLPVTVHGEGGDDVITLNPDSDSIVAYVYAGEGNDTVTGSAGADSISGDGGNDTLDGGDGDDTVGGGAGNDAVNGGAGNDLVTGDDGSDNLDGGDGADYVTGNGGVDTLFGGPGDDTLYGDAVGGWPSADTDYIHGGAGNDTLYGDGYGFAGGYGGYGATVVAADDHLWGDDGDDILYGEDGSGGTAALDNSGATDYGGGADRLDGGAGNDTLVGEDGADHYVFAGSGHLGTDTINEYSYGGRDTLDFSTFGQRVVVILDSLDQTVASTLALRMSSSTRIENVRGTPYDDVITGSYRVNELCGFAGNDTIRAGSGDDFLYGGLGSDLLDGEEGTDLIDQDDVIGDEFYA